jgi:hypothetical protein
VTDYCLNDVGSFLTRVQKFLIVSHVQNGCVPVFLTSGILSADVKRLEREADPSPLYNYEFMKDEFSGPILSFGDTLWCSE